jgi:hypothetical protein
MGVTDTANVAAIRSQRVERLPEKGARSILRADLHHPAVLPGGRHHLLPFPKIMGKGFFDIHILARLAGPHRGQRVPVVRQGDDHRVDRFVIEDAAQIAESRNRLAAILEGLQLAIEMRRIHIAERDDFCPGHFAQAGNELMTASPHAAHGGGRAHANDRHADGLAGAARLGRAFGSDDNSRQAQRGAGGDGSVEETSAGDRFHRA